MRLHTVDYRERDREPAWFNKGFFFHDLPRLTWRCHLFGHAPVVDGVGDPGSHRPGIISRWIVCDRCGIRPEPQGYLDPIWWSIGERYSTLAAHWTAPPRPRWHDAQTFHPPGRWPRRATAKPSAQIVAGGMSSGWGVKVKVGSGGSENKLSLTLHFGRLLKVYLDSGMWGAWWWRRLNPRGLSSRVTGVHVERGHLSWRLWVDRNGHHQVARWRDGLVSLKPLDLLLGPPRYGCADTGHRAAMMLRLPDGEYPIEMKLQHVVHSRKRGRSRFSWGVDWRCKPGIPTVEDDLRSRICGSWVPVSDRHAIEGTWPDEALAQVAVEIQRTRAQLGGQTSGRPVSAAAKAWRK